MYVVVEGDMVNSFCLVNPLLKMRNGVYTELWNIWFLALGKEKMEEGKALQQWYAYHASVVLYSFPIMYVEGLLDN